MPKKDKKGINPFWTYLFLRALKKDIENGIFEDEEEFDDWDEDDELEDDEDEDEDEFDYLDD